MRTVAAFILILLGLPGLALAEPRVALVVGNATYAQVSPLDNAGRDAQAMAEALEKLGFEVNLLEDATQITFKRAVSQFGRDLRAAGPEAVGLFYYAGHGVQSFGANYLLPVDASLTVAADLDLVGLEASSVLRQMASARNRTNIFILDACRDNPFVDIPDMNDNGLAEMKAPTGTFLAYATAPGAVALDGTQGNSPFTASLVKAVQTEGLPIEQVFKQVRVEVIAETKGAQTPWDTSSLTEDFSFVAGEVLTAEEVAEEQLWHSVRESRDPVQIMLFMRSHPNGRYQETAREMLGQVMAEELNGKPQAPATAVAPTPAPAPEVVTPANTEVAMMEAARASGALEDYQAYLESFPAGIFSELVKIEIASLKANASHDPDGPAPEPKPVAQAEPAPEQSENWAVLFDQPLSRGVPAIVGKTIMEVAQSSPLYAPIEGLPETMWKDQQCSNCHQWNRDDLCTQAQHYQKASASRSLGKEHPFGGTFKRNLKFWADGGCK